MKSLLHSLADSESVLLMYLFDELPDDDRADVEAMLSTDHGLRARLDELRAIYTRTNEILADADATSKRQARSVDVAERNAIKLLGQWTVRKTIDRAVQREVSPIRKYVLYPAMGLAAMMLMGLILWGMFGPPPQPMLPGEIASVPVSDEERMQVAELQRSLMLNEVAGEALTPPVDIAGEDMLVRSLDSSDEMIREAIQHRHLSDAESEIAFIARMSEDPDF